MGIFEGTIYYKNGTKEVVVSCSGAGAEQSAEYQTAKLFDQRLEWAKKTNDYMRTPTRYDVKEV